ncbi:hypothetical protein EMIT0158MI4_100182 [Burkholderia ambifaria]
MSGGSQRPAARLCAAHMSPIFSRIRIARRRRRAGSGRRFHLARRRLPHPCSPHVLPAFELVWPEAGETAHRVDRHRQIPEYDEEARADYYAKATVLCPGNNETYSFVAAIYDRHAQLKDHLLQECLRPERALPTPIIRLDTLSFDIYL